jgi:Uma2 family endonuclease
MSDMAIDLPLRPITVDEYHRMADVGILEEDERIELLGGMLVKMPPIGQSDLRGHGYLVEHLMKRLGDRVFVSGMASVPLGRFDEPQPDVTVFARHVVDMREKTWTVDDVYAVFEIADSSMRRDTGPKLRAYASGGVAEYFIADVKKCRVLRHRNPIGKRYETIDELTTADRLELLRVPGIGLEVAALFRSHPKVRAFTTSA